MNDSVRFNALPKPPTATNFHFKSEHLSHVRPFVHFIFKVKFCYSCYLTGSVNKWKKQSGKSREAAVHVF